MKVGAECYGCSILGSRSKDDPLVFGLAQAHFPGMDSVRSLAPQKGLPWNEGGLVKEDSQGGHLMRRRQIEGLVLEVRSGIHEGLPDILVFQLRVLAL